MRPTSRLLSALALVALLAPAAHAQIGALGGGGRALVFGIGGGASMPVGGTVSDALKTGFNGLAYARYQMPGMPFGFGVNVSFHRFDMKDAVVSNAGATKGTSSLLAGVGDIKYNLMRTPLVTPYLLLGIGAYNVQTSLTGSGTSTPSTTRFGVNGGLGVSAKLGSIRGFLQGRIDNVFTQSGVIDTKQIQVVPVTLGLEF